MEEGKSAFKVLTYKPIEMGLYESLGVDEWEVLERILKIYVPMQGIGFYSQSMSFYILRVFQAF